jgi:hypothetical protein
MVSWYQTKPVLLIKHHMKHIASKNIHKILLEQASLSDADRSRTSIPGSPPWAASFGVLDATAVEPARAALSAASSLLAPSAGARQ